MGCYKMGQKEAYLAGRGWTAFDFPGLGRRVGHADHGVRTVPEAYALEGGCPPKGNAYRRPRPVRPILPTVEGILLALAGAFFGVKRARYQRHGAPPL